MIVSKKPNHGNHDQACRQPYLKQLGNVMCWLNYEKLQYKKQEVDIFSETYIYKQLQAWSGQSHINHQDACP